MTERATNGAGLRVGLFGIGLDTYWAQFAGLEERLKGYLGRVEAKLRRPGVEVVSLGLIDTPEKAAEAGHRFRQADVDLIFLYVTTYALSATVLPVVRRAKVPVIVLNLAPAAAIDYRSFNALGDRTKMTGEWLAWCQACSVPEIANVFRRAGISFHQVTGNAGRRSPAWDEISDWIDAARVAYVMEHNRLGVMGHYYGGMLDIYSDLTQQCAGFGGHVEIVEVDELASRRERGPGGGGPEPGRAFPRGVRRAARLSGGGAGAGGAHVRGPRPPGGRPSPRLARLLLHGRRQPARTRTRSARSSSATACSPLAACPWRGRWRSRTSRP